MAKAKKKEIFLTSKGIAVYVEKGVKFDYSTEYSHGSMFLNNLGK